MPQFSNFDDCLQNPRTAPLADLSLRRVIASSKALRLVLLLLAANALVGCGSVILPVLPPYFSPLTGNWNIAGNRALAQYPLLSLAIFVDGSQITARGDVQVQCTNQGGGIGGTINLVGTVAADGTFQLAAPSNLPADGTQVVITGTVPSQGATAWIGSYSIVDAPTTNCTFSKSAAFLATALAPFDGTYSGTIAGPATSNQPAKVSFNITVSQGAAASSQRASGTTPYFPLTATVTVTGLPCFTHGSTVANNFGANQIEGDFSSINFQMEDGSLLLFSGNFASPDESAINPALFAVFGGKCDQDAYSGVLNQQ
jgi:hypothetical protein